MDLERTPLLTDLYELTMLQTYYEHGMTGEAVFELFFRAAPHRGFFVAAGLEQALDWLTGLRFGDEELAWMRDSGHFSAEFVERMAGFRFTGEVRALPEGTVFFAEEPVLQITAPLPEGQLVESRLMNIVHYQTLIATKAARCRLAAGDRRVVDFGMRRAHGGEAGLWAGRACHLAGFEATATCLASARYGVPATGTMAHAFILAHDDEAEAFERFARSHPHNVVLLIDTYDVEAGARKVVEVARRLRPEGIPVRGVRIDSGDLAAHARKVRRILDAGGLQETRILVSGGLDEHRIARLVADGAPIDGFGVGSQVDTSADVPFLDSAYKLHEFSGRARGKRSEGKTDLPGRKQVFREQDADGRWRGDTIGLADESLPGEALLAPVMQGGERVDPGGEGSLERARAHCADGLRRLPEAQRALKPKADYPVSLSPALRALREQVAGGAAG
ncbi:nicotinate phosphoribosyltransferase [Sediminicurvatus halobius]|uniref:Nicotinate phosphoribosyltransferase n=1 Tax=Sediminicurvatus halobius TaxID=2182432 RepID=A0A2U2N520_9GAMM|nr:nicotinate phosphoribosyltransferase [Spiribacter halobius]PWG64069.1 nicotinate phosphoribosyltransferase [Spiribacter halobius]UEX76876.1 nicotinate phosphoribosyltransferase [Spiribacter halobius]